MLFHDHDVVILRLPCGHYESPLLILRLVLWLKQRNDLLAKVQIYEHFSNVFIGFSVMALLVMSIDSIEQRYLGAYYPFFHSYKKEPVIRLNSP